MSLFGVSSEEDLEFVIFVHDSIIDASGGSKGFHNEGLIKSALARPLQTFSGKDVYPTLLYKAAALLESLAQNHGFKDGNKRTAMAVTYVFLTLKDVSVEFTNKEYEEFMLHVVNNKPALKEIAEWLASHSD